MDEQEIPLIPYGPLMGLPPEDEATKAFFAGLDTGDQSRFVSMFVAHFSAHFGPMFDNVIGRNEVRKAALSYLHKLAGYAA